MQLYHIVFNNLYRRKAKMLFVLLGLVIGIATIVSVYGIVETMKTQMTKQVTEFGVNVVIKPDSDGLTLSYGGITLPEIMYDVNQLTTADLDKINTLPSKDMIRVMAPKLLGMGTLTNGQKITVVGANLQEEFKVKPWLRIGAEADETLSNEIPDNETLSNEVLDNKRVDNTGKKEMDYVAIDLTREDLEQIKLLGDEVIIGSVLAKNLSIGKGDTLTIEGRELRIYATLLESGTVQDQQMFMNLSDAQSLLGRSNEITVIEMAVDYFAGSEEILLAQISEELPETHVTSLRQETLRQDEMLARLVRFGMAISLLVLFVGMFIVGLTMLSSVRERTREIGIFRAIGFRKKHIMQMIIMEGTIISIVGGVIGFIVGMLIARYAGPLFTGSEIQIPWQFGLLLVSIGISVMIGLMASLYPAYQATKLDPVEALRFI